MPGGAVVSLYRYPVKSMMGEEVNHSHVTERGLLGDRSIALVDVETGKVVSAKNPRRWPEIPPVLVTLPDGTTVTTESTGFETAVSAALGRPVRLAMEVPAQPTLEEYWPDIVELSYQETVTDEALPVGTFFDLATIHVLTTATIDRLRNLCPGSRFESWRFRPNIVIRPEDHQGGFVESRWVGKTLRIGDDLVLTVTDHCPRCGPPQRCPCGGLCRSQETGNRLPRGHFDRLLIWRPKFGIRL